MQRSSPYACDLFFLAGGVFSRAAFVCALGLVLLWPLAGAWAQALDVGVAEKRGVEEIRAVDQGTVTPPASDADGALTDIPTNDVGYTGADKIDFLNEGSGSSAHTLPSGSIIGEGVPMTLERACQLAVQNHPRIVTSEADLDEAEADFGIARSAYYPRLDWLTKVGPSRELDTGNQEYGDTAMQIVQKIYKFGGIRDAVASARLRYQSAQLAHARTEEDIAVLAINAYLTVLQAQEQVRVYEGALQFYEKLLHSFEVRYAGGISSLADVQKVEVSLRDAEAQLVAQNEQFSTSRSLLENVLDTPVSSVEPNVDLLRVSIDGSIEESYRRALDSNLNLQAMAMEVSAQERSVGEIKAEYYPVIGGRLQVKNEFQRFKAWYKFTQTAEAQLTVDWNLFNGYATTNKVKKRQAALRRLRANKRGAELEIKNVLTDAWNAYTSSAEEYKLAKEAFDSSVSLMSLYLSEFDLGIRTLLDLTAAREGQTSAAVREVNARFRRIQAALNILLEEGRLESSLKLPLGRNALTHP